MALSKPLILLSPKENQLNNKVENIMSKSKKTKKTAVVKTQREIYKDLAIAILVTGIIAFALGMKFESRANKQIEQARAQASAQVVEVKK